jgi:hypothetical protein
MRKIKFSQEEIEQCQGTALPGQGQLIASKKDEIIANFITVTPEGTGTLHKFLFSCQ